MKKNECDWWLARREDCRRRAIKYVSAPFSVAVSKNMACLASLWSPDMRHCLVIRSFWSLTCMYGC